MTETAPDIRPAWNVPGIDEATFRRVMKFWIVKVHIETVMTSEDSWKHFLVATNPEGRTMHMPPNWEVLWTFIGAATNQLFQLNRAGKQALKRMIEIDDWEKKHSRDLREYRRLKRKFEGID